MDICLSVSVSVRTWDHTPDTRVTMTMGTLLRWQWEHWSHHWPSCPSIIFNTPDNSHNGHRSSILSSAHVNNFCCQYTGSKDFTISAFEGTAPYIHILELLRFEGITHWRNCNLHIYNFVNDQHQPFSPALWQKIANIWHHCVNTMLASDWLNGLRGWFWLVSSW